MKYLKRFNEGATDKAARRKDKNVEVNPDKMDLMRKKVKDHVKSLGCDVEQVGNDYKVYLNDEHIAQVMFRKDYIGVQKTGNKTTNEFGYNERGSIEKELTGIIKKGEKSSKEEYDILCMIGDVQHDEEEGVSPESFSKDELEIVNSLEKDGFIRLNRDEMYVLTKKGQKYIEK